MSSESLPPEWSTVQLNKLIIRVSESVDVCQDKTYQEIGIRSHGKGIFYKEETSGRDLGNKRVFWIQPECLILNIVFAWEGAVARTTHREAGMIASHRFPMYRPTSEIVDLDYLLYFLKSSRGTWLLRLASPGGAGRNKTLGQAKFMKLKVPVPPRDEQRKIAHILSTWDDAITTTEQLIDALERRKKGLMQRLLTGHTRLERFGAGTNSESELPHDWDWIRLDHIFKRVRRSIDKDIENVLSITAGVGFQDQREKFGRIIAGKNLSRYVLLKRGEFAYNKGNSNEYPQGCIYRLEEFAEGAVPNVYYSFRTNSDRLFAPFYKYYFEHGSLNQQLQRRINTGVRNDGLLNLSSDDFFSVKIAVPPVEEQMAIAEVFKTVDTEIELHKQQLRALNKQRKGLMQRLLTGQVRVQSDEVLAETTT